MKIGLLGGTFDPIHNGHLEIAKVVQVELKLDKIIFMPCGKPPHKRHNVIASKEDRFHMAELALGGTHCFKISDYEIKKDATSYTVDTLKHLKNEYQMAEFYFIGGADVLFDIEKWRDPRAILSLCSLVILTRAGFDNITQKAAEIENRYNCKIILIDFTINISSSEIREKLKNGLSVEGLVPSPVIEYINENGLYN